MPNSSVRVRQNQNSQTRINSAKYKKKNKQNSSGPNKFTSMSGNGAQRNTVASSNNQNLPPLVGASR